MRLDDLFKLESSADLDVQLACGDLFGELLKRRQHEVFRTAVIGRQVDSGRNHIPLG